MGEMVFEDVLAAVAHLEPSNIILSHGHAQGYLLRTNTYQCMELPDGTIGAFPPNMMITFYRGENGIYPTCLPSLYRTESDNESSPAGKRIDRYVILDRIRLIEFEMVAKQFPQVQFAIEDHCNVDFVALAQHYGLKTDLIDITCDLLTACFFATHKQHPNGEWETLESGYGRIRGCLLPPFGTPAFEKAHLIGLQPFERPGRQCAFALKMDKDEDFSNHSWSVKFKQNKKANAVFYDTFVRIPQNTMFPQEDIGVLAEFIRTSGKLSRQSVNAYARRNDCSKVKLFELLASHSIQIIEGPICGITLQRYAALARLYKGRPYGDVNLISRLSYI